MNPSMTLPEFDSLWNFEDPRATENRFQAIFTAIEPGGAAAYMSELLTQIARAQGLQDRFEEAQRTLDRAESLIGDRMERARIRLLLERGRVYNSSGDPQRARSYFLQAWNLAEMTLEEAFAIDAAHMLGIVEQADKQIEWSEKALEMARRSQRPQSQKWVGPLLNNLGWSYHDLGQFEKALKLFEESVQWRQAQDQAPETRIAHYTVARVLRSMGRNDEAMKKLRALEKELDRLGQKDGFVFEELGENLLALGYDQAAAPYFQLAYQELSQDTWLAANESERLERLKQLCSYSTK